MAEYLSNDLTVDELDLLEEVLGCDMDIFNYQSNYLGDGLYFVAASNITREQVEEINFRFENKLKEMDL